MVWFVVIAGVDHAYQYLVDVKSRFSLFLDDTLNKNEEVDSHAHQQQQQQAIPAKVETARAHTKVPKAALRPPKSRSATDLPPVSSEDAQNFAVKETEEPTSTFVHGRGSGREELGAMRGDRGQGPWMAPTKSPIDLAGDANVPRKSGFKSRGRGRGRGRGTLDM
ncbi:unnamed protein product [Trichobilharzia regenti]|nr:unnamed protein product [Trichobilharzia regenti]